MTKLTLTGSAGQNMTVDCDTAFVGDAGEFVIIADDVTYITATGHWLAAKVDESDDD